MTTTLAISITLLLIGLTFRKKPIGKCTCNADLYSDTCDECGLKEPT